MAHVSQLPCGSDGMCMLCKAKPAEEETLTCKTCATPWHVTCLSCKPETMAEILQWECPDCSTLLSELPPVAAGEALLDVGDGSGDLVAKVRAIEADASLTEMEKAWKRQQLMSGKAVLEKDVEEGEKEKYEDEDEEKDVLDLISGTLNCSFCMQLPERPVTV